MIAAFLTYQYYQNYQSAHKRNQEYKAAFSKLNQLDVDPKVLEAAQSAYVDTFRTRNNITPDSGATPSKGIIYIQIRDDEEQDNLKEAINTLQKQGFFVPGVETVPFGPTTTEVRFFKSEKEEENAERVAEILKGTKIAGVVTKFIPGYENSKSIRKGQIEIWFDLNAFQ
jgi:DNA polymerase III delta subunit